MKLAILGASGASGQYLMEQALADGHQVVALVRNPEKITITNDNLEILTVDIFSEESLSKTLSGCNAVLSCLGPPVTIFSEVRICQDSIKPICAAMRNAAITRLICMSSGCVRTNPDNPMYMEWLVKPLFLGRMFTDLALMEDYLSENCQDIKYTVVKPTQLQSVEISDEELVTVEGDHSPDYRLTIPRPNVTKFMLDCLNNETWNNKFVTIGLKK